MKNRRDFACALGLALLAAPLIAAAQTAQRLPVVGVLNASTGARGRVVLALTRGMLELGFVEGTHFTFELRSTHGNPDAFAVLAAELAALKVDLILAVGPAAVTAARQATRVIPIVAIDLETDPVQAGWVHSLARPGGNVTGLFLDVPALAGKWLELLQSAAPKGRRFGLLWDSSTRQAQVSAAKAAAQTLGIEGKVIEVRDAKGIEQALRAGVGASIDAIVILGVPMLSSNAAAKQIADFAAAHRLPTIASFRWFVDAGGLMFYGPNTEEFQQRTAGFVAKILKGAKPGDLAIELPTKFELVINLKTAKALGLTIPQSLLLRADEVIQ